MNMLGIATTSSVFRLRVLLPCDEAVGLVMTGHLARGCPVGWGMELKVEATLGSKPLLSSPRGQ